MNHGDIVNAVMLPVWAPYVGVFCMIALAWLAKDKGCRCEKCGFHQNEMRMKRERDRALHHKANHAWYRGTLPWGDDRCGECRAGHADDEHLR